MPVVEILEKKTMKGQPRTLGSLFWPLFFPFPPVCRNKSGNHKVPSLFMSINYMENLFFLLR